GRIFDRGTGRAWFDQGDRRPVVASDRRGLQDLGGTSQESQPTHCRSSPLPALAHTPLLVTMACRISQSSEPPNDGATHGDAGAPPEGPCSGCINASASACPLRT